MSNLLMMTTMEKINKIREYLKNKGFLPLIVSEQFESCYDYVLVIDNETNKSKTVIKIDIGSIIPNKFEESFIGAEIKEVYSNGQESYTISMEILVSVIFNNCDVDVIDLCLKQYKSNLQNWIKSDK